jgi:hypothetical protein
MEGDQRGRLEREPFSTYEEDARRREEAIRALAAASSAGTGQNAPTAAMGSPHTRRHESRRWLAAVGVALIVVLVLIGVFARNTIIGRATNLLHPTPASLRINLTAFGYSCPSAMAWSPDGSKLAVLAQQGPITSDQAQSPCAGDTLLVFSAQHGMLVERVSIASTLKAANASLTDRHDTPSWSPDATTLALPTLVTTGISAHPVDPGVLLIPLSGAKPFIIHAAVSPALQSAFLNGDVTTVWDTRNHSLASATTLPLPPALAYTLDSAGRLVVAQPLSAQASADTLTGSPGAQTGATRSLWQPGALIVVDAFTGRTSPNQPASQPTDTSALVFYSAALGLWSPDGRFVDPQVTLGPAGFPEDAQALAGFDPQSCVHFGLAPCVPHAVPYPDHALQVVKNKLLAQNGAQSYAADTPIAWSPGGAVLATIFPLDSFLPTNDTVRVTLLSTRDGSVLKTLTARTSSSSDSYAYDDLAWSPTGNQLAFRDAYSAAITIWGGSSLVGLR